MEVIALCLTAKSVITLYVFACDLYLFIVLPKRSVNFELVIFLAKYLAHVAKGEKQICLLYKYN